MSPSPALADLIPSLSLQRLGPGGPAGLLVASLPLSRDAAGAWQLGDRPTYSKPLGQWWDVSTPAPRRVLLAADGGNDAPQALTPGKPAKAYDTPVPQASAQLFAQSQEEEVHWERHALKIQWQGRSVELAMGMRVDGQLRWWEHGRLVKRTETPQCLEVEMGGCIPHQLFNQASLRDNPGYTHPGLHRHHWLNGHIYARLHANGVCEVYAHHINSRFVDDGGTLEKTVPIVGIRAASAGEDRFPTGDWDGSDTQWTVGGVQFDWSHVGHLASTAQPGNVGREDGFVIFQPYQGVDLYGGLCPNELTGDPFIFHARDQFFPKGMARTLRFSLSLNPQRSARVARYLPPAWWYGLCEEFSPKAYLPVKDEFDRKLESCQGFLRHHMVRDGFEDGSLPRGVGKQLVEGRHEPGWEGEAAGATLLLAYRTGEAQDYDDALRAAYCYTDLYLDHATKLSRMHGFAPYALNVPMTRLHACVMAWLETGDPYTLNTARALLDGVYWTHKNSWPRMAVGRDACFIRGAMAIYRYTGEARALDIARDSILDVAQAQMPGGWFGDQGGGSGLHGWAAYIAKPWMGLMAVGGLLDFLDLHPDGSPEALQCVKQFADWLMRERFDHDGVVCWSYQHHFNNKRSFRFSQNGELATLPTKDRWHMDYLARLMAFCTMRFNDPSYYQAFLESYRGSEPKCGGDHTFAQSIQYLPWVQAMTWRARWENGKVVADPLPLTPDAPQEGVVLSPAGPVKITRNAV